MSLHYSKGEFVFTSFMYTMLVWGQLERVADSSYNVNWAEGSSATLTATGNYEGYTRVSFLGIHSTHTQRKRNSNPLMYPYHSVHGQ